MMELKRNIKRAFLGIGLLLLGGLAALPHTCVAAQVSLDLRAEHQPRLMAAANSADAVAVVNGLVRYHRLAAGAAKVNGLAVGDQLQLQLFDDKELSVELAKEMPSLSGKAFLARSSGGSGALDCVVQETEQGLTVDVTDSANNRVWQVVSGENGVQVREARPQGVRCPSQPLYPSGQKCVASASVGVQMAEITPPAMVANESKAVIDILVAYDTQAATWAKANGGGLTTFAEKSVNKMNLAIANTGLDAKFGFRLVGVHEIGASAEGDFRYALKCGSGEEVSSSDKSAWAKVAEVRDQYAADIVSILIDTGTTEGTTGLGYSLVAEVTDPASCGYNVCAIRSVATEDTMTHEVGHNMGAGHSDQMADKGICGPQYHEYSSGYYFSASDKKYYTIMAYNDDGYGNHYDPVPYFSSPDHTYAGVPVGDALHNNTKTLSQLYATVAANRKSPEVSSAVGVGLDAEKYTWTTDGTYPWTKATDKTTDGADSAVSSLTPTSSGTSWTETQVTGPATLSFAYLMISCHGQFQVTCDGATLFSRGGADQDTVMNEWEEVDGLSIPSGKHVIRFAHFNNGGLHYEPANAVWVDQVVFDDGNLPPPASSAVIGAGLDAEAYTWTTGKVSPWAMSTDESDDGVDSAVSNLNPSSGGTSWTETRVVGPATLSFSYMLVSYGGRFQVTCDGTSLFSLGGAGEDHNKYEWQRKSGLSIPAGEHAIRFSHTNTSGTYYSPANAVWVDKVVFAGGHPPDDDPETTKCTVTFNANGGAVGETSRQVTEGDSVGTLPTPAREGYSFVGWFTAAADGTAVTASTVVTADVTFFAHWAEVAPTQYTVTFNANGGTVGETSRQVTEGDSVGTLPTPAREGYSFVGWFTAAAGGTVVTASTVVTADVTFFAHWAEVAPTQYTVMFDANGGIAGETSRQVEENAAIGALPTATREGYDFLGWFIAAEGGVAVAAETVVTADMTVYAHWKQLVEPEVQTRSLVASGKVDLALDLVGYTAKGLPAGLKFDAKKGKLTGTCKTAGSYTVTFSKGGEDDVVMTFEVVTLPAWATGTFNGRLDDGNGSVTMTVGTGGKVSGKIIADGQTWSFAATTLELVDGAFIVEAAAKSGKEMRNVWISIDENGASGSLFAADELVANLSLWRNAWKDARAAAKLVPYAGLYTVQLTGDESGYGYLSLTVDAKGNCKAAGKLPDGTSASSSLPLVWNGEDGTPFAVWQFAPSAYKGGCVGGILQWADDRSVTAEGVLWTSRSPTATGEYGAGFERTITAAGAWYDKQAALSRYYGERLAFSADAPQLDVKGVAEPITAADLDCWGLLTISLDAKGTGFAVDQGKATKPVQDKATKTWSYGGANDAALTVNFAKATGVFKGSFTAWYDYEDQKGKQVHTSKKASFEGVMVLGEPLRGFCLWERLSAYRDAKSGKEKSYKYGESLPVAFE